MFFPPVASSFWRITATYSASVNLELQFQVRRSERAPGAPCDFARKWRFNAVSSAIAAASRAAKHPVASPVSPPFRHICGQTNRRRRIHPNPLLSHNIPAHPAQSRTGQTQCRVTEALAKGDGFKQSPSVSAIPALPGHSGHRRTVRVRAEWPRNSLSAAPAVAAAWIFPASSAS